MAAVAGHLVVRAAGGDQAAWDLLVERYTGLVWSVARGHRLDPEDAADVVQTTWLKLLEHLATLEDPDRVGAWLAGTARRESLVVLRQAGRRLPADDRWDRAGTPADDGGRALRAAMGRLPGWCRTLLRVLMSDPPPSPEEVGAAVGMPPGGVGRARERCLRDLRAELERGGPAPRPL